MWDTDFYVCSVFLLVNLFYTFFSKLRSNWNLAFLMLLCLSSQLRHDMNFWSKWKIFSMQCHFEKCVGFSTKYSYERTNLFFSSVYCRTVIVYVNWYTLLDYIFGGEEKSKSAFFICLCHCLSIFLCLTIF